MRGEEGTPGTDPEVVTAREREGVARAVAAEEDVEADSGVERPARLVAGAPAGGALIELEEVDAEVDGNRNAVHGRRDGGVAAVRRRIRKDGKEVGRTPGGRGLECELAAAPPAGASLRKRAGVDGAAQHLIVKAIASRVR